MSIKKLNQEEAQRDVDALCERDKNKREVRDFKDRDLIEHLAQILLWARAERSSKRKVARLIKQNFKLIVSSEKVYRFVKKHNDDVWPHQRVKNEEQS